MIDGADGLWFEYHGDVEYAFVQDIQQIDDRAEIDEMVDSSRVKNEETGRDPRD